MLDMTIMSILSVLGLVPALLPPPAPGRCLATRSIRACTELTISPLHTTLPVSPPAAP